LHEVVEKYQRQDRVGHGHRRQPVEPHETLRHGGDRKVAVDHGVLVAVAHGAEHHQQFRGKDGIDILLHGGNGSGASWETRIRFSP
jgi:hypothetical protein